MDYIRAIIYGIIEGITEWLPISSTGHLILLGKILRFEQIDALPYTAASEFYELFNVFVQLGAVLALPVCFLPSLIPSRSSVKDQRGARGRASLALIYKLAIATLPAATLALLSDAISKALLGRDIESVLFKPVVVAFALIFYGVLFLILERRPAARRPAVVDLHSLSPHDAFIIGLFEALSIVPGTSRSGACMIGGRAIGCDTSTASSFSFLCAIPIISGAGVLKLFRSLTGDSALMDVLTLPMIMILVCAALCAFLVSLITVGFLTRFVRSHTFLCFGIYRIILGAVVLLYSLTA